MKAEYLHIFAFLAPYTAIWADSILQNWPASSQNFPPEWIESLRRLNDEDLRQFAHANLVDAIHPSLQEIIQTADSFEGSERNAISPLDAIDNQGLNRKKQHEIERLLPLLAEEAKGVTHAVDIGGGVGHLARICVKRFAWRFHTIDRDADLQEKGRWWLKRTRNFDRDKLTFVPGEFSREKQDLDAYFSAPETLSLGLHTCGSLAVTQFRKSLGSDLIVNFGCCYDKTQTEDLNLSAAAKTHPIPWNQSSLFLATRSRKDLSEAEFALLRRVNDYRFSFDLLMRRHFPELGFVVAGDAPKSLYLGEFTAYVLDRLSRLGLPGLDSAGVKAFHEEAKDEVFQIFAAHLIRNLFARPLEHLLLLDRALWLTEQGFRTDLLAVFDRKISPRNLALIARRSSPAETNPSRR